MAARHPHPPAQQQRKQPGREHEMEPEPEIIREGYIGSERLAGKRALITGGDSGIGRSVAVHFAAEGAAIIGIVYLDEDQDANQTAALVEAYGATCIPIRCDLTHPDCAAEAVEVFRRAAGNPIDVLVKHPNGGDVPAS